MKPIGYLVHGDTFCVNCYTHFERRHAAVDSSDVESEPIFYYHEGDSPTHCIECSEIIPHHLTDDGHRYVEDSIIDYLRNRSGNRAVIQQWYEAYEDRLGHSRIVQEVLKP